MCAPMEFRLADGTRVQAVWLGRHSQEGVAKSQTRVCRCPERSANSHRPLRSFGRASLSHLQIRSACLPSSSGSVPAHAGLTPSYQHLTSMGDIQRESLGHDLDPTDGLLRNCLRSAKAGGLHRAEQQVSRPPGGNPAGVRCSHSQDTGPCGPPGSWGLACNSDCRDGGACPAGSRQPPARQRNPADA